MIVNFIQMTLRLICYFLILHRVSSELTHGFAANSNGENKTWKHSSNYLLDRYPIRELPSDPLNCRRQVKCVEMQRSTCMGTRLPYTTTTLDLIPEGVTQDIIEVCIYHINIYYCGRCF